MQYPNVGAPSPQEIYEGLKMIPNNAQGKQMLGQLAQQGKQTGSIEGGIATAILNSYNKAQPTPPPPQGQVVDQVLAQAQPPMDPNMMGLAMPGLEGVAQQNAQQMATGGIVALAHGGPVREFDFGGVADLAQDSPWMGGMPDVPDAPDTSAYEQDYFSAPEPAPATTKGAPVKHTYEQKLNMMQQFYGVPPDVAAEIMSQHEHENARRSKFNMFENIASGLAGYLGSYGSGQHRAGAGLASMMATMGEHQRAEDKEQATMDVLRAKSLMAPYEQRKAIMDQILASETAGTKAEREAQLEMAKLAYLRGTGLEEKKLAGEYDILGRRIGAEATTESAQIRADAAAKGNITGPRGMTWNQALVQADNDLEYDNTDDPKERAAKKKALAVEYFGADPTRMGTSTGAPQASAAQSGFSNWLPAGVPGYYLSGSPNK